MDSNVLSKFFTWVASAANSRSCPGLPGGSISSQDVNYVVTNLATVGNSPAPTSSGPAIYYQEASNNIQVSSGAPVTVVTFVDIIAQIDNPAIVVWTAGNLQNWGGQFGPPNFSWIVNEGLNQSTNRTCNPNAIATLLILPIFVAKGDTYTITVQSQAVDGAGSGTLLKGAPIVIQEVPSNPVP